MKKSSLKIVDVGIFEKALNDRFLLRCEKGDFSKDFYCIAKTDDGDYILEERKNASVVEKLSAFAAGIRWRIVDAASPKAFIPKDGEVFCFIHLMPEVSVKKDTYRWENVYYHNIVKAGLAFKTEEDAKDALIFFQNNIEE